MRSKPYNHALMPIVISGLILALGCAGSSSEETAQAIYQRAKVLQDSGQDLDALREFDRLIDFQDTKVFAEADASLSKDGISIGSALESWTLKRMFKVKNEIIGSGMERHPDGDTIVSCRVNDAWDRPLMIEYSQGPKYSFVVISSGKDKTLHTDDDLKLYRRLRSGDRSHASTDTHDRMPVPYTEMARAHQQSGSSPHQSSGERVVDLNDLLQGE